MMTSGATKYSTLLRILDAIRAEAKGTKWEVRYGGNSTDSDLVQQARSRAFIHLYLKVMFGIADFSERETYLTDGANDGGVDGYFIDREMRRIYLLQSKFRNTEKNFEQKEIAPEELLVMDIDRITGGQKENSNGVEYNGKVQGLIRHISELPDVARYNYQISIIANCNIPQEHLRKLTEGHHATVFNFERSYNELVFPIVAGTYFRAQDVTVQLDLTHKSAGAKTSYSVSTPEYECEITVLFIPTLEIAKVMDKYRNSILEYNPRSYLELDGQRVNSAIRQTLLRPNSNEFALMNNGITILSDETNLNERIGQHNKAQLRLLRPQIINGGQTAYTLSRILDEDKLGAESMFKGKEVLTKIITLTPRNPLKNTGPERLRLIEEISVASNRQTPVNNADRASNEPMYPAIQKVLFEKCGIFYERNRGEFNDGIRAGYIDRRKILERNLFLRIFLASRGDLKEAVKKRIFIQHTLTLDELTDSSALDVFADGFDLFNGLSTRNATRNVNNPKRYRDVLAKIYIGVTKTDRAKTIGSRVGSVETLWAQLLSTVSSEGRHFSRVIDGKTGERRDFFAPERWMANPQFSYDVKRFVEQL
jgi:hypothetical protein